MAKRTVSKQNKSQWSYCLLIPNVSFTTYYYVLDDHAFPEMAIEFHYKVTSILIQSNYEYTQTHLREPLQGVFQPNHQSSRIPYRMQCIIPNNMKLFHSAVLKSHTSDQNTHSNQAQYRTVNFANKMFWVHMRVLRFVIHSWRYYGIGNEKWK